MPLNQPIPKWHVVIMAGGVQPTFWGIDETKHLVKILGEPILLRTVRLLLELCDYEITVITPSMRLEQYSRTLGQDPRIRYVERPLVNEHKLCGALDATPARNPIILWGDVFFSRISLKRILNEASTEALEVYCRYGPSELTLKTWGEPFALRVRDASRNKLYESGVWVQEAFESGEIWRALEWEVFKKYAEFENFDGYRDHPNLSFYREINDFTEDIDFPEDHENLLKVIPSNLEDALDFISNLNLRFLTKQDSLQQEKDSLQQDLEVILGSRSWRFTAPLRAF